MANINRKKGVIGILTGGGDVPGLNPAIRGVTFRALREGYQVIGFRRGWAGLVEMVRDEKHDNSESYQLLTEELVNRAGRTGGTFLHSSRTNPSRVGKSSVPAHLKDSFSADKNDLTAEVLKNLEWLGVEYLIPIGGDDTLSYGVRLQKEGFKVIGIPKTMDNDVPGTDYCIGFSTCVTRTIHMTNDLRTSAGSHERFMVLEVFGRYAGFSAMLPTMAGAANRCVIPEHKFDIANSSSPVPAVMKKRCIAWIPPRSCCLELPPARRVTRPAPIMLNRAASNATPITIGRSEKQLRRHSHFLRSKPAATDLPLSCSSRSRTSPVKPPLQ